jgi:hypothetical protein
MNQTVDQLAVAIEALKFENIRLKKQIELLESRVLVAERKCACFRNSQKMSEEVLDNS